MFCTCTITGVPSTCIHTHNVSSIHCIIAAHSDGPIGCLLTEHALCVLIRDGIYIVQAHIVADGVVARSLIVAEGRGEDRILKINENC